MEVTYKGPSQEGDITSVFMVRDEDGNMHTLRQGYAAEVPDSLGKALTTGDDPRFEGHSFEKATKEEVAELEAVRAAHEGAAEAQADTGGGSGGTTTNPAGGGTATASART